MSIIKIERVPRAAGWVVVSSTGMKKVGHGKGGTCLGWGWNTGSHFYVMVAIGSHCKDLAFLQRSWRASAGLCHPLPKPCQLSPSNSRSPYYTTLHHWAPTASLICPSGAPACPLVAILPCLSTSSLAPTSGCVSLPFSQHGPLIPQTFTCLSLHQLQLFGQMSPSQGNQSRPHHILENCKTTLPLLPTGPSPLTSIIFFQGIYHILID